MADDGQRGDAAPSFVGARRRRPGAGRVRAVDAAAHHSWVPPVVAQGRTYGGAAEHRRTRAGTGHAGADCLGARTTAARTTAVSGPGESCAAARRE